MNPLKPSPSLLCKVASVVVHAEEMLSPSGHDYDKQALISALQDPELKNWIQEMTKMGMAPVKR
jgi:hypothetical protein